MLDFKNMSAEKIREHKEKYIGRLDVLSEKIARYMEGTHDELKNDIVLEYTDLKTQIKKEADFLKKESNSIIHISDEHNGYQWGIMEANAFGFKVRVNSKINQEMFNSVREARYRIDKYSE